MQYQEILQIDLIHNYYLSGKLENFSIQPNSRSAQWLSTNRVKLISNENQMRLIADGPITASSLNEVDTILEFQIVLSNHTFFQFTDWPIDKLVTLAFSPVATSDGDTGDAQVLSKSYEDTSDQVSAVIRIPLSALFNSDVTRPLQYTAVFKARSVAWRYYIVNQGASASTSFQIAGANSQLFKGPTATKLNDGSKAQLFESTPHVFVFKENLRSDLSLVNGIDQSILIKELPSPDYNTLQTEVVDGKAQVYASAYIYV